MARTIITPTKSPGSNAVAAKEWTWVQGDPSNGNRVAATGSELILARNVDTGASHTVTFYSMNGQFSYTLAARGGSPLTEHQIAIGTVPLSGYKQTDGYLWFDCDSSSVEFAVLVMP